MHILTIKLYLIDSSSCFSFSVQELRDLFKSIDQDEDGSLCLSEVIVFLKSITDDLSTENIEKIFNSLDKSGDRSVDFHEFKVKLFKL